MPIFEPALHPQSKKLIFIILLMVSILLTPTEVNSLEYPGFQLRITDELGIRKTAYFRWYGSYKGFPSLDRGFWGENGFGTKYLIEPFGLNDYSTNRKDVYVAQGVYVNNKYGDLKQYTHYIPHKEKNKYCLIHVFSTNSNSGTSDKQFKATFIGCFNVYKP